MTNLQHNDLDWNNVIKQAFFNAWSKNSVVDVTTYFYKISNHFNLHLIVENLQTTILNSDDKERDIKYHTNRLRVLSNVFVLALLSVSDDGKMLTGHNIELAKLTLQNKTKCSYE